MTPEEKQNTLRALANKLLDEFNNKNNKLTYRELLNKYSIIANPMLKNTYPKWLQFNVIVHNVNSDRKVSYEKNQPEGME
ncbi:hypothetical protein CBW53_02835 [Yersinia frederiksenii]|nr:hypothetical protein CBW53_02835 [Yersinia frederiksenii]CNI68266.1 Uncharacterised protein [Yersinia frederiksenii]